MTSVKSESDDVSVKTLYALQLMSFLLRASTLLLVLFLPPFVLLLLPVLILAAYDRLPGAGEPPLRVPADVATPTTSPRKPVGEAPGAKLEAPLLLLPTAARIERIWTASSSSCSCSEDSFGFGDHGGRSRGGGEEGFPFEGPPLNQKADDEDTGSFSIGSSYSESTSRRSTTVSSRSSSRTDASSRYSYTSSSSSSSSSHHDGVPAPGEPKSRSRRKAPIRGRLRRLLACLAGTCLLVRDDAASDVSRHVTPRMRIPFPSCGAAGHVGREEGEEKLGRNDEEATTTDEGRCAYVQATALLFELLHLVRLHLLLLFLLLLPGCFSLLLRTPTIPRVIADIRERRGKLPARHLFARQSRTLVQEWRERTFSRIDHDKSHIRDLVAGFLDPKKNVSLDRLAPLASSALSLTSLLLVHACACVIGSLRHALSVAFDHVNEAPMVGKKLPPPTRNNFQIELIEDCTSAELEKAPSRSGIRSRKFAFESLTADKCEAKVKSSPIHQEQACHSSFDRDFKTSCEEFESAIGEGASRSFVEDGINTVYRDFSSCFSTSRTLHLSERPCDFVTFLEMNQSATSS